MIAGIGTLYFVPGFIDAFKLLYQSTIGDIITLVIKNSKEDFTKAYNFGLRIMMLLIVWFILLFIGEFLISLGLRIITWPFFYFFKKNETISKNVIGTKIDSDATE
jgi:signal transduction histidine kinase